VPHSSSSLHEFRRSAYGDWSRGCYTLQSAVVVKATSRGPVRRGGRSKRTRPRRQPLAVVAETCCCCCYPPVVVTVAYLGSIACHPSPVYSGREWSISVCRWKLATRTRGPYSPNRSRTRQSTNPVRRSTCAQTIQRTRACCACTLCAQNIVLCVCVCSDTINEYDDGGERREKIGFCVVYPVTAEQQAAAAVYVWSILRPYGTGRISYLGIARIHTHSARQRIEIHRVRACL